MAITFIQPSLREKLVVSLQDTHALEQNVLRMLDSMIATTADGEVVARLEQHRRETRRHEDLIRRRLEALGARPALTSTVPAFLGAWLKGLGDRLRADKPGKNARDGYITEHVEIAAYSLLEQLALRAGDWETARVARDIRADEEEMADWIDARWDRFVDRTLAEGAPVPHGNGRGPGRLAAYRPEANIGQYVAGALGLGAIGFLLYQAMKGGRKAPWGGPQI